MCTLLAAFRHFRGFPLVVAANRDEQLDRPASPIHLWSAARFLAPRDETGGGTWLGLNASGLFVGVTNRFGVRKEVARESRGMLVVEALGANSARDLHARLAILPAARFNAFHLFYADASHAFVTWSDGSSLHQATLGPGVHVVTERSLGGDDRARTELVRKRVRALDASRRLEPEAIFPIMRIHGEAHPLAGTCVHIPEFGYGTRSSMVLLLGEEPDNSALYWAEGNPCENAYEGQSRLLDALTRATGDSAR
jgi:uncharacterized protein with NRDE domain